MDHMYSRTSWLTLIKLAKYYQKLHHFSVLIGSDQCSLAVPVMVDKLNSLGLPDKNFGLLKRVKFDKGLVLPARASHSHVCVYTKISMLLVVQRC